MAKAYDKLSWRFILKALRWHGFSNEACNLLYQSFSNCWYSVLWGGKPFGFFKSNRGVRQGDPLSSLLFAIAMNLLSFSLNKSIADGAVLPYGAQSRFSRVQHLLYADDLLVFANGSRRSFANLFNSLSNFCRMSGLEINLSKSCAIFSKRFTNLSKRAILDVSGFSKGSLPFQYLGVPIFLGRAKICYFKDLECKLMEKIEGWSKFLLSAGGRITLIQSALSCLPLHSIAVIPVPKTSIARLQKLIANFFWDSGASSRRHWVRWSDICRPKSDGGLGLRSLSDFKKAFQAKLAWKFLQGSSLWAEFARKKYQVGRAGSAIWNAVDPWISKLRQESFWEIGKGEIKIILLGVWLHLNVPAHLRELSVRQVIENRNLLEDLLLEVPPVLHGLFGSMQLSADKDMLIWRKSASGSFSVSDFCKVNSTESQRRPIFQQIWQPWIPMKISVLCWKILLNALPTNDNIRSCGIQLASKCCCCPHPAEESVLHIFIRGHNARVVWDFLSRIFSLSPPTSISQLSSKWLATPSKASFLVNIRAMLASCALWELWTARNQAKYSKPPSNYIRKIKQWAANMIHIVRGNLKNNLSESLVWHLLEISPKSLAVRGRWRKWIPWPDGLTLTMDAGLKEDNSFVAGIIWDSNKNFIIAMRWPIRENCIFQGILEMLERLRAMQMEINCIQSSSNLFACITNPSLAPPWASRAAWRKALSWGNRIQFVSIPKEFNIAATILVYNGMSGAHHSYALLPTAAKRAIAGRHLHTCIT